MISTEQLSKRIAQDIQQNDEDSNLNEAARRIDNMITWHIDDILALLKNINDTSVNSKDRTDRIIEAQSKYGIPTRHLL